MRILTLITDWKKADYYYGVLRGILMSGPEEVKIIEITDQIENFKIDQAALILRNCYKYYPAGTIHIVGVKTEPDKDFRFLWAEWEGQYFIFPDNGFATLFWPDDLPEKLYESKESTVTTFPEATIMAQMALELLGNKEPETFSNPTRETARRLTHHPSYEDGVISGTVIHTDSYGNAITNVSKLYFEKYAQDKNYIIIPANNHYAIKKIHNLYNEVNPSEQLAVFNHAGMLEIAIRNGSARDLLGLKEGTNIRIELYDITSR